MLSENPQKLNLLHTFLCKKSGSEEVEVRFFIDSVMGDVGVENNIKFKESQESERREYE